MEGQWNHLPHPPSPQPLPWVHQQFRSPREGARACCPYNGLKPYQSKKPVWRGQAGWIGGFQMADPWGRLRMKLYLSGSKQSKSHKRKRQDDSSGEDDDDINDAGENQDYNNEVGDDKDENHGIMIR
ncbi:hypothetical protein PsorP6_017457 [Peronosclerospora sorghi]|uniref:Uncharacterized protein n=1 Tax=Peronosclerospora sorghi TaxID=230839 RepID=A0ACC0WP51_9STRA|nr:hypothetical protein PsorP6_017457 [Peronosclerospora sorghi]